MAVGRVLAPPRNLDPQLRLQGQIVDHESRITLLERASLSPMALPFGAGWGNYGSVFQACTYYIDRGRVWLEGLAISSSTNTTIATLPSGFRPPAQHIFTVQTSITAAGVVRLDVQANGVIIIGATPANGHWASFSGINFRIA